MFIVSHTLFLQAVFRAGRFGIAADIRREIGEDVEGVIFLAALDPCDHEFEAAAKSKNAFRVAKRIASRFAKDGGIFVTLTM